MFHASSKIFPKAPIKNIRSFSMPLSRYSKIAKKETSLQKQPQYRFTTFSNMAHGINKINKNEVVCDFGMFDNPNTKIDSIIILNNQLNYQLLSRSMKLTDNIILADGGANHFYALEQFRESQKIKAIVGDLDCIKPEIIDFYNEMKIPVQYSSNLENNDFCKSLQFCLQQGWERIFVFGAFGGRMDQTLSCMHYCEKYSQQYPNLQIFLFGQSNLMYLLKRNRTYHLKNNQKFVSKFGCGIISFGTVENVQTQGFKYNLGEDRKYQKIEWGEFISTSNQMTQNQCSIRGSDDLFFVANYSKQMMK